MSYKIVKGTNLLDVEGIDINGQLFIPLKGMGVKHGVIENKIVYLESPLIDLKLGLVGMDNTLKASDFDRLKDILQGAGCIVQIFYYPATIPNDLDIVIVLNPREGVFKLTYSGFSLNGSKKLSLCLSWAMERIFNLEHIAPVTRQDLLNTDSFLTRLTTPTVNISWGKGNSDESLLYLGYCVLLGLIYFVSGEVPKIHYRELLDDTVVNSKGKIKNNDESAKFFDDSEEHKATPEFTQKIIEEKHDDDNKARNPNVSKRGKKYDTLLSDSTKRIKELQFKKKKASQPQRNLGTPASLMGLG